MSRRVPVARRALFQDRRRAGLTTAGVSAALLLVLLLQGIFDGAMQRVTTYLRSSPADVIVSQKDVRTMHMSVSVLDPGTPERVRRVDGVAWAEGIRYTTTFVATPDGRQQLTYVIGYDTATGIGGPRRISAGRAPRNGEILVEAIAADRLGVKIGDDVQVFGDAFRVSGTFHGGTTIVNTMVFVTADDFVSRRGDAFAYVLVGAVSGVDASELAARLAAAFPEDTVQTKDGFAHEEAALIEDMSADLMRIMTTVALLIALAVVGLALFTLTLAKLRDYAVLKALGGRTQRLGRVVLAQAAWSISLAVVSATALAVGLGALIGRVSPTVAIAVEPGRVVRLAAVALVAGALGAVLPIRRVVTVDPISAFRRGS